MLGNRFLISNNWTAIDERCFLCGPYRDLIPGKLESAVHCREVKGLQLESVKRKVEVWCEMAASLGVRDLEQ
jgi:hypothetical protein